MKKILSLLLCVVLSVTSLITVFAAEPKISYKISDTDIKLGETVTITVSISNYQPLKSLFLAIDFNTDVLKATDDWEWLIDGGIIQDFDDKLNAVFMLPSAKDVNGDIFRFTLLAKDDAPSAGDMDITIEPQLRDENDNNVETETEITISVTVSCAEHKYGNLVPEVPAKCGIVGKKAYYECSVCHKLFNESKTEVTAEQLVIPALTHVAEEGWYSDVNNHWKVCANGCGTIMDGTTAAHKFEWKTDKPATEDETGIRHEECTVCGYKRSENTEIPKLPHVHTGITHHEAVAADCHETGTVEYLSLIHI